MSDNENRNHKSLRSDGRRSLGQILLIFLVAVVLIISVAAVALAEDSPLRSGEPTGESAVFSAEELQYRKILQGITMSPNDVDPGIGCLQYQYEAFGNSGTLTCGSEDVRLGSVTNIVVSDPCDGTPGDEITFSADFKVINGQPERPTPVASDGTFSLLFPAKGRWALDIRAPGFVERTIWDSKFPETGTLLVVVSRVRFLVDIFVL